MTAAPGPSEPVPPDFGPTDVLDHAGAAPPRVAALGAEIAADYAGRDPLLVGVLKGAFVFMADLVRAIPLPVEVDFMAVSSYGSPPAAAAWCGS